MSDAFALDLPAGGDSQKGTLVFVHGAGNDHTVWTPIARYFSRTGYRAIALDLPAHGRSGGDALTSIGAMADWLAEQLARLDLTSVTLIGHSMGALTCLDCAARHPERIAGLALVATTVPMPVAAPLREAAEANSPSAFEMLTTWGYSRGHTLGGNRNPGVWMVGSTLALFERSLPGVLAADLNACNDYATGLDAAAQVSCPTLLLLGAEDRLTAVRTTQALQASLQHAQVEIVPGSGHTLMVEATSDTIAALRGFLAA